MSWKNRRKSRIGRTVRFIPLNLSGIILDENRYTFLIQFDEKESDKFTENPCWIHKRNLIFL